MVVTEGRTVDPSNPDHYKSGSVEVIDVIREQLGPERFEGYCVGNAIKYLCRAGKKTANTATGDYRKAAWYCRMAAGDDPRPGKERRA